MFCRVVGSAKITDGITHVMALNISKLSSANEITTHLLKTQWIRLKLRQLKRKNNSNDSQLPNSFITTLSPLQCLIYTIVKVSLVFQKCFCYIEMVKKIFKYRQKQTILELKKQSSWNVFMVNYRNEKSSKYIVI